MKKLSKIQENINLLKQKMAANAKGKKKSAGEFCLKDRNNGNPQSNLKEPSKH